MSQVKGRVRRLPRPSGKRRAIPASAAILLIVLTALLGASPGLAQGKAPAVCKMGVSIEDLYDLDMARDTFGATMWLWSLCPSPDLKPLETIEFASAASLNLGNVTASEVGPGQFYASRHVQGTFRYNWNMDFYPFDRQRIVIPIDESEYGADTLVFEADTASSFLNPNIRDRLDEWKISDLTVEALVTEHASTYGVPGLTSSRYARLDAIIDLERTQTVTFFKLTSGVFAAAFIAFISFFYDPNDRSGFGGKLGLLVGCLFAVLVNLRSADTSIGDMGHFTLVTKIHLVTLVLIIVLAFIALWDRRKMELGGERRHPDWPKLTVTGAVYLAVMATLIIRAAMS